MIQCLNEGQVGLIVLSQVLTKPPIKCKIYGNIQCLRMASPPFTCQLLNMLKVKKFKQAKQSAWLRLHSIIHTATFLIKCAKGSYEMEGSRYSRLTYFSRKRNIILGAWAQMCLRMYWGGVLSFPRLCEQGDSLLCLDLACVCSVCLFPNELSCSAIEIHKMSVAGQSVQLVVAFIMKFEQWQNTSTCSFCIRPFALNDSCTNICLWLRGIT